MVSRKTGGPDLQAFYQIFWRGCRPRPTVDPVGPPVEPGGYAPKNILAVSDIRPAGTFASQTPTFPSRSATGESRRRTGAFPRPTGEGPSRKSANSAGTGATLRGTGASRGWTFASPSQTGEGSRPTGEGRQPVLAGKWRDCLKMKPKCPDTVLPRDNLGGLAGRWPGLLKTVGGP